MTAPSTDPIVPPVVPDPAPPDPVVPPVVPPVVEPPAPPAEPAPELPTTYTLKVPDGMTVDPSLVDKVAARARALRLTNEGGQALLDATLQDQTERESADAAAKAAEAQSNLKGGAAWQARVTAWDKASKSDAELALNDAGNYSSVKFTKTVELAQQGLRALATPALTKMLDETGLGSHPEVVRLFAQVGKRMAEPNQFLTGSPTLGRKKTPEQVFYGGKSSSPTT